MREIHMLLVVVDVVDFGGGPVAAPIVWTPTFT